MNVDLRLASDLLLSISQQDQYAVSSAIEREHMCFEITYTLKKVLQASDFEAARKIIAHNICIVLMTVCGMSVVNTIYTMNAGFIDILVTQLTQQNN